MVESLAYMKLGCYHEKSCLSIIARIPDEKQAQRRHDTLQYTGWRDSLMLRILRADEVQDRRRRLKCADQVHRSIYGEIFGREAHKAVLAASHRRMVRM